MDDYEIRNRSCYLLDILAKAMSYTACYIDDGMLIFLKKLAPYDIQRSCVFHFENGKHKALKFKKYNEALQYLHNALLNNETISVISLTSKDSYVSITPELAGEFLFECALNGDLLADCS